MSRSQYGAKGKDCTYLAQGSHNTDRLVARDKRKLGDELGVKLAASIH